MSTRGQALVRFAYVLCGGDGHRAEDLVQAALAKVWRRWDRICRGGNPEAYLHRVIVSQELSWRRRRWSTEKVTSAVPEQPSCSDETERVDAVDVLWRTVAGLPAGQRAVLVLRFVEDWSDTQIAAVLGCSEATVRSQASRGLVRLRRTAAFSGSADVDVAEEVQ